MPAGCPAFRIGERIRFGTVARLKELEQRMRSQQEKINRGEIPMGICEVLVEDMVSNSGQEATIKAISAYHFDVPIYEFHEVAGRWLEEALCDPQLDQESEGEAFQLAKRHYSVHIEKSSGDEGFVEIRGLHDGRTYWRVWRRNLEWIAGAIEQITEMRTRSAFEWLFMFDRRYEPDHESNGEQAAGGRP